MFRSLYTFFIFALVCYTNSVMTTYLLHGGATSKDDPRNDAFFRLLTELSPTPTVRIMQCYWAREQERQKTLIPQDQERIRNQTTKKTTFYVASDPIDLLSNIHDCDVLYVAGGESHLLEPFYAGLASLKPLLAGKMYAGSSMGAFMAAASYVLSYDDRHTDSVHSGLGLLPIQTLCHWDMENEKATKLAMLSQYSTLPILTLHECQSVVMYG